MKSSWQKGFLKSLVASRIALAIEISSGCVPAIDKIAVGRRRQPEQHVSFELFPYWVGRRIFFGAKMQCKFADARTLTLNVSTSLLFNAPSPQSIRCRPTLVPAAKFSNQNPMRLIKRRNLLSKIIIKRNSTSLEGVFSAVFSCRRKLNLRKKSFFSLLRKFCFHRDCLKGTYQYSFSNLLNCVRFRFNSIFRNAFSCSLIRFVDSEIVRREKIFST